MRCPKCQNQDDKVIDSRTSRDGAAIRRRRDCLACSTRFTTYEHVEQADLLVVKMLIQFAAHPIRWFSLLAALVLMSAMGLYILALFKLRDGQLVLAPVYDVFYISAFAVSAMVTLNLFILGVLAELQLKVSGFFRNQGAIVRNESDIRHDAGVLDDAGVRNAAGFRNEEGP